ncbi:MAG: hypothetical protein LBV19_03095 [Streptococcaceae bacterium]|jgi:hypothetical protein|nr:hypothetical protein [Streptococcaceae bacterium]
MLYILLDIDGTLLPGHTDDPDRETLTIKLGLSENEFPLTFYADVIHEFAEISRLPSCEIIMCTSWDESSLEIGRHLDINCSSYMTFVSENPDHWYKWDSIVKFCEGHPQDKVILCDDLASREFTRPKPKNLVKIFQPNPRNGLTMRDLKKIRKLVEKSKT